MIRLVKIFRTAGSNPHEVNKAVIQARLLSGKYRFERFQRHYSDSNREGICSLNMCQGSNSHEGNIESFFLKCKSLEKARDDFRVFLDSYLVIHYELSDLIKECILSNPVQFYLDASVVPAAISEVQSRGYYVLNVSMSPGTTRI